MGLFDIFKRGEDQVNDDLLDDGKVNAALDLTVQDRTGAEHSVRSLLEGFQRSIVVFVRHHHCGACMAYVRHLNENEAIRKTLDPQERQKPKDQQTNVLVIGHGSYEGIDRYLDISDSSIPMYVDSSKKLYRAWGVTCRSLKQTEESPKYFQGKTHAAITWESVKESLGSGQLMLNGGDIAQNGAELVFDAQLKCIFAHRMRTSSDHAPVADLARFIEA